MNIPALIADLERVPVITGNYARAAVLSNVFCITLYDMAEPDPESDYADEDYKEAAITFDGDITIEFINIDAGSHARILDWAIACLAVYRKHMGDAG